jgi:sec-independent protein translocase protein TatA
MGMSFWHLLLILIVVFVFFGAGRLPNVMGDIGKGVRSLREGLKGDAESGKIDNKESGEK